MSAASRPKLLLRDSRDLDYKSAVISTLGPPGTSSEFVARHLSTKVELFDSYELAEQYIHSEPDNTILLVANAYKNINHFYISERTKPTAAFFLDTPPYVFASKIAEINELPKPLRVSSHPAPAHLLHTILPESSYTLVEASSTSEAARMVADSETDACITTRLACERENLVTLSDSGVIPMLWTIFTRKSQNQS